MGLLFKLINTTAWFKRALVCLNDICSTTLRSCQRSCLYLNPTILFKPLKHATFHRFFLFYYNFHSIDHSLLTTSLIINQFIRFPDPIKRL